jgi:hypothetical protein
MRGRTPIWMIIGLLIVTMAWLGCTDKGGDDDDDDASGDDDAADDDAADDDAGDDDSGDDDVAVEDPCPGLTTPGEYECKGCPDIELPGNYVFEIELDNSGTWTFSSADTGPVADNVGNGTWYLERTAAIPGMNIGPISTSGKGAFGVLMPIFCDTQLMKGAWSNPSGTYCVVHELDNFNCGEADIRVTITWGPAVYDLELHLIRQGGQINNHDGGNYDCTWTNMDPDWGVQGDVTDNPHKDVDDTGEYGIENIWLTNPENVVYDVMVEYWASGDPSTPQVVFNVDGQTTVAAVQNLMPQEVWHVATIDWTNHSVTLINNVIDCSGDWSSGCLMDIP